MAETEVHKWFGTLLDISNCVAVTKPASLKTSRPYFNNIVCVDTDYITEGVRPPYYGDTVNLAFWRKLDLAIGHSDLTPQTLTEGYKYIFNYATRIFTVTDKDKQLVKTITNVNTIADLNIDFTIYKSHQFIILLDILHKNDSFYIPVRTYKDYFYSKLDNKLIGTDNVYLADTKRPYEKDDIDNPTWDIKHIFTFGTNTPCTSSKLYTASIGSSKDSLSGLIYKNRISFLDTRMTNYFYADWLTLINVGLNVGLHGVVIPSNPPAIDREKCYDKGDMIKGNKEKVSITKDNIIYVVYNAPKCEGNEFIYTISNASDIKLAVEGTKYFKGDVIEYITPTGSKEYYYVLDDFILGNLDNIESETALKKIDVLLLEVGRVYTYTFSLKDFDCLLPCWSLSLYPALGAIQRPGETGNNRPVYEPWMIYGFYKFIYSHFTEDYASKDHEVMSFDLSPNWA